MKLKYTFICTIIIFTCISYTFHLILIFHSEKETLSPHLYTPYIVISFESAITLHFMYDFDSCPMNLSLASTYATSNKNVASKLVIS